LWPLDHKICVFGENGSNIHPFQNIFRVKLVPADKILPKNYPWTQNVTAADVWSTIIWFWNINSRFSIVTWQLLQQGFNTFNSSLVLLFSKCLIHLIFSHRYRVITLLFSLHRSIIVAILIFDVFVAPASEPCPELMSSWSIFSTLTTLFSPYSCYSVLVQDYLILYPGKINRHVLLELLIC